MTAGKTPDNDTPAEADPSSRLGISRLQTEAATITPEAKPSMSFCIQEEISLFRKKTKAAPITVPARGISRAVRIPFINHCKDTPKSLLMLLG